MIHAKRRHHLDIIATDDWDRYILTVHSNETSADFLFAPLTQANNRMHTFKTSVRSFLGLPVTATHCNIGHCVRVPVAPNGDHSIHAHAALTKRHHRIRDALGHVFQRLFSSGQSDYRRGFETTLDDLGFTQKVNAPDTSKARCDIYLENMATGHKFVMDVSVTQPGFEAEVSRTEPLSAAKKTTCTKVLRYVRNYEIDEQDVIPLVFETYGGYSPTTFRFLKDISMTIANNDADLAGTIFRHIRDRIAVALHTGQGGVIAQLNSLNYASLNRHHR